ncbi:histidine kinase [Agromyces sp. H66]|uniref:sensor histidine kinase n=1 Tax=Agromyces sp. H66 TaxID=2529859 RepID=UPI0010AA5004|nr:histidine kinase [Agromyces sp. H66]
MGASYRSWLASSAVRREAASGLPESPADEAGRSPSAADWVWAAAFAAALLPVTVTELLATLPTPPDAAWLTFILGMFVVLHLLVVVRRKWPRGTLLAASAVMLALTVATLPGLPYMASLFPSAAVYLVFVFSAAASDDRVAVAAALGLGLLGAALMTAVAVMRGHDTEPAVLLAFVGFLVAAISAAWALGRYRHESGRRRAAQNLGLRQAAEIRLQAERAVLAEERRRIGRELHDVVSHSLAVMVTQAEASRVLLDRDQARARSAIEQVVTTGRSAMADMRGLLGVLVDAPADSTGADGSPAADGSPRRAPRDPSPGLGELTALVEQVMAPGRSAALIETGVSRAVSPGTALVIYRVVQESLTNTLRHTVPPTASEVRLDWGDDELVLEITDDGTPRRGASPTASGSGIRGMQDRVERVGGRLLSGPRDGGGWRTRAVFPYASEVMPDA